MKFFTNHPESIGETYFVHLWVALGFAFALFGAACAAFIHAIFPAWFEKTASQKITELHDRMVLNRQNRQHQQNLHKLADSSNDGDFQAKMSENARV
jgi:Family of unknown function (DUF6356)